MNRRTFTTEVTYSNSRINFLINEYVHSRRDRKILKLFFIDGITIERIAEDPEVNLTSRQVSNIISARTATLQKFLNA